MNIGDRRQNDKGLRQIMNLPRLYQNNNRGVVIDVLTNLWLVQVTP